MDSEAIVQLMNITYLIEFPLNLIPDFPIKSSPGRCLTWNWIYRRIITICQIYSTKVRD